MVPPAPNRYQIAVFRPLIWYEIAVFRDQIAVFRIKLPFLDVGSLLSLTGIRRLVVQMKAIEKGKLLPISTLPNVFKSSSSSELSFSASSYGNLPPVILSLAVSLSLSLSLYLSLSLSDPDCWSLALPCHGMSTPSPLRSHPQPSAKALNLVGRNFMWMMMY